MNRALTREERRLITRGLLHLVAEYTTTATMKEQTGDGRSVRMRLLRLATEAQELAMLINSSATEITVRSAVDSVAT